jgi:hypothetical protein
MSFIRKVKALLRMRAEYQRETKACQHIPVKFHSFGPERPEDNWFYRFIRHRGLIKGSPHNEVAFFSVFGARRKIRKSESRVKVFYTGENVHWERFPGYKDHCVNEVDLSLGFDYRNDRNYLRFPVWLLYIIEPESDAAAVKNRLEIFSSAGVRTLPQKAKFCAMVAGHDPSGVRSRIFHGISKIAPVDSGGAFLNNTPELRGQFNNDKVAFLERYKFNICAENSNAPGYVTEKPFHAIQAGCVPVYWGSANKPEPEVLNQDALLLWDDSDNGRSCVGMAKDLHSDASAFSQFVSQPRFVPGAADYVIDRLDRLEQQLAALLKRRAGVP